MTVKRYTPKGNSFDGIQIERENMSDIMEFDTESIVDYTLEGGTIIKRIEVNGSTGTVGDYLIKGENGLDIVNQADIAKRYTEDGSTTTGSRASTED